MISANNKRARFRRKQINDEEGSTKRDGMNRCSQAERCTSVPLKIKCEECSSTSKVVYRPLVSDTGAYLCDTCYKVKFPATAMCDMNDNQNILIRKYNEIDIRKKHMGKIDHGVAKYTEEEECCSCLEQGIYRKCCKKYYCNLCYYNKSRSCPGCGLSIHRSGVTLTKAKPQKMTVLATWGISVYLILLIITILYLFVAHNLNRPETVWEGTCRGWFPSCNRPVCIEVNAAEILMPTKYKFCSISSVKKVIGRTCIVDAQLYHESKGLMGYDVCLSKENTQHVSLPNVNDKFEDGIYVFEDDFDYWINNTDYTSDSVMMKSARWSNMINAQSSDICGFNNVTRPHQAEILLFQEEPWPTKIPSALVFSGVQNRFCETMGLNVRFGGRVEFYLKLAPLVENELATQCKSAFGGDIRLMFSVNNGTSWSIIKTYPVWKFRSGTFSYVNETIPFQARSNHTRFRWDQPVFDSIRDFWALDDIRIFHNFEPNWKLNGWYEEHKSEKWSMEQHQQCNLDTEHCLNIPNYRNELEDSNSHSRSTYSSMYRIKIIDMFILASTIICLIKKACHDFQSWFEDADGTENNSSTMDQNQESSAPKMFELNISKTWQSSAFLLVNTPFGLSSMTLLWHMIIGSADYYNNNGIQASLYLLALGLDFWTVRSISMNVLHFWPCYILPRVKIDKSYQDFKIWIDDASINILDVSYVNVYSECFCCILFVCVMISGFPLATTGILIKMLQWKYEIYIVILEILGCSLVLRSIVGPLWFVEVFLATSWVFTLSTSARDTMGLAMERPSVRHVVSNAIVFSAILYIVLLLTFEPLRNARLLIKLLLCFLVIITGAVFGALLGMLRGLPVSPKISLTTWPTEGFWFVNERCTIQPHTWAKIFGGGMNSFQFHTLQLKHPQEFRILLSGSTDYDEAKEARASAEGRKLNEQESDLES